MAMTRKDYELVALTIAMLKRQTEETLAEPNMAEEIYYLRGQMRAYELITDQLRWNFTSANSNFDSLKFQKACGYKN